MVVRLVPSAAKCTAQNADHNGPLSAPSCSPSTPSSHYLRVGTIDANGQPSEFKGYLMLNVQSSTPVNPDDGDQADVQITAELEDVRRASDLGDYTGELQGQFQLRMTDRANSAGLDQPATSADLPISFTIPCQATPDPDIGSTCKLTSSVDTLLAGAVKEGKRSVWAIERSVGLRRRIRRRCRNVRQHRVRDCGVVRSLTPPAFKDLQRRTCRTPTARPSPPPC